MDISSLIGTLMGADSTQGISQAANTNGGTVQNVLSAALPALINGAQTQSQDTSTGFAQALLNHGQNDTSNISDFFSKVDLTDGGKIISHLFGGNSGSQLSAIASSAGASQQDTSNILSAAAPFLMSLLGKQSAENVDTSSDNGLEAIGSAASSLLQNVDIGGLLGGLLGANSSSGTSGKKPSSQGGLLGLLGKLFK